MEKIEVQTVRICDVAFKGRVEGTCTAIHLILIGKTVIKEGIRE